MKKVAQVPNSLLILKLYPPLEYPLLDMGTPEIPLPSPPPSPPTNINTPPPLSLKAMALDDDSCPGGPDQQAQGLINDNASPGATTTDAETGTATTT